MADEEATRLVVERVAKVWRRPWVMVTGRLEGAALRAGDTISIIYGEKPAVAAVIRSIEVHSPPGKVTVALDASLAESLGPGAVLSRPGDSTDPAPPG